MSGPVDVAGYLPSPPMERRAPDALEGMRGRVVAGAQTVHGFPVLTTWTIEDLRRALEHWVLPEESAFPGLPCIVFAGNVGGPDSLAEVIQILRGD